ncbi:glycosyltransferase family 2 protein [Salegentibacter sp. HM20]
MELKNYTTTNGEVLLYTGNPDTSLLENLVKGPGDLWHSSLDQGYLNIFPELVYQTAVFWWYLNDLPELEESVNWRINPNAFVIRKRVWDFFKGFDESFDSIAMSGLDMGYRMLRFGGGTPMYVKGLFQREAETVQIPKIDIYRFYRKNFKARHSLYLFARQIPNTLLENIKAFNQAKVTKFEAFKTLPARPLGDFNGEQGVDVIIPTMSRQEYTLQLLKDYKNQSLLPNKVIIIDATPEKERRTDIYIDEDYPFELIVRWQQSKGSCRARNEAIRLCTSDYIIFADDDTRILPDFVENHIRFLQTYGVDACTGLDIQAQHYKQDLEDLKILIQEQGEKARKSGAAQGFNNANSCVKRGKVEELIGNDVNFDGGYGEDSDFGYRLIKNGNILMYNPYSINLHLKPPSGGYRVWGLQASVLGKKRKKQAWELDQPVGKIKPVPSPTIVYGILKHFKPTQVKEYKYRYLFLYLTKDLKKLPIKLFKLPYKIQQFNKALLYAEKLKSRGERFS